MSNQRNQQMNLSKSLSIKLAFFLIFVFSSFSFIPEGLITDQSGVLPKDYKKNLEIQLSEVAKNGGPEIAIVFIDSLEGNTIEKFAFELFNQLKIGQRESNNGLLILTALKERKIRIEVGYGLEGALNDAKVGRIIKNQLAPHFAKKEYCLGLNKALNTIYQELKVNPSKKIGIKEEKNDFIIFMVLFVFILLLSRFKNRVIHPNRHVFTSNDQNRSQGFSGFGGGSSGGGGASGSF